MSRRIDVELTSTRDDGTWTWRAAGAKQPKGIVEQSLLYEGAKVGDVVRAEAEFEVEGITIVSVFPPKEKKRTEPERIEILGTPRGDQELVTSTLVPKGGRRREGDRGPRREGDRGPRREGDRGPRGEGAGGPRREGAGGPRREGAGGPRREGAGGPRREGAGAPRREGAGGRGEAGRPAGDRPGGRGRPERQARPERPAPPKPKRLSPANVHRAAVLESLPPEMRPIAEQVLRGGLPAVRQAVEHQNAEARQAGQPEVKAQPLIAMAEELLPRLKAADWRDRAEAAAKDVDEISLRDLRSVVAGADAVARDDEARLLASTLREALDRRVDTQRQEWVNEITTCLDEGRLVRALRLSARAPDPTSRFPAELATRLSEAASAAMAPDAPSDRWGTLLEAVAASPVRRNVKPVGLPAEPGEALLQAARQASGRVPALAAMLGIDMPPPPGPPRGGKPGGLRRPPKPATAPPARVPNEAAAQAAATVAADASVVDAATTGDATAAPAHAPEAASEAPTETPDTGAPSEAPTESPTDSGAPADADAELPAAGAQVVDAVGSEPSADEAPAADTTTSDEAPADADTELPVQD